MDSDWELEFRDCGAIPGRGLLLTVERPRGGEEGDCGGKYPWRKARHPWMQGNTAESCVGGGATIASSLPTQQHLQLNNREAGPSNA